NKIGSAKPRPKSSNKAGNAGGFGILLPPPPGSKTISSINPSSSSIQTETTDATAADNLQSLSESNLLDDIDSLHISNTRDDNNSLTMVLNNNNDNSKKSINDDELTMDQIFE
ncbi:hypothetical protein BLA29_010813, partial [Euroglyphus maynei]